MAGRINDEDIALVRQRAHIEDIIGSYVALKSAGSGTWKGLCPFHDEKTPSFSVTSARGFFYCFGCGQGGDVITFVEKHLNLSFVEAVQHLADKVGVQLRITEADHDGPTAGQRVQILQANALAEEFYAAQLASAEGLVGRQFLADRGFDRESAEYFQVGYAPRGGQMLYRKLRSQGVPDEIIKAAGLGREGGRDFFVGRLVWPIRESGGAVLGFGARRIYDDDRRSAKYLNTPETPVYKKSQVLYGLDLARKAIGKKSQAVVMEGYTDVMAAHLAGVDTAVASCGTAFGDDHGRLLQRLMGNNDAFKAAVIFTFDGDAAGQAAALKVFKGDKNFIAQTYVAVEPTGLDPCDLRIKSGDAAVRELVARRIPLYRFVMNNIVSKFDLDRVEGRLGALREASGLLSSIRDESLVTGYLHELAGTIGMDIEEVRKEVAHRRLPNANPVKSTSKKPKSLVQSNELPWPDPNERNLQVERDTLKLMLQYPTLFDTAWNGVQPDDFRHPAYRQLFETLSRIGYGEGWPMTVQDGTHSDIERQLTVALIVEPILGEPSESYATSYTARLQLLTVMHEISKLKSRLQRTDPTAQSDIYRQQFERLLVLESRRKELQLLSIGETQY